MVDDQINKNLQHLRDRLRVFRKQRGYSLRELAARADVSTSLLSQIENGKTNPSVMVLHNIAAALDVPLMYFFSADQENAARPVLDVEAINNLTPSEARAEVGINLPGMVEGDFVGQTLARGKPLILRHNDHPSIELQGGVIWERLTSIAINGIEFLRIDYGIGASSGSAMSHHPGSEFGYVLEGRLTLNLGFDEHILYPGDSVVFNSSTPHRLSNTGDCSMRALWVIFDSRI